VKHIENFLGYLNIEFEKLEDGRLYTFIRTPNVSINVVIENNKVGYYLKWGDRVEWAYLNKDIVVGDYMYDMTPVNLLIIKRNLSYLVSKTTNKLFIFNEDYNELQSVGSIVSSMNDDLKNMLEHEYSKLGITYMAIEDSIKYNQYPDGRKEVVSNKE
jgi:hypothetical protein